MDNSKVKLKIKIQSYLDNLRNFENIDIYEISKDVLDFISENQILNNKFEEQINNYTDYLKTDKFKNNEKAIKEFITNNILVNEKECNKDYKNLVKSLSDNIDGIMQWYMERYENNLPSIYSHMYSSVRSGIFRKIFYEINKEKYIENSHQVEISYYLKTQYGHNTLMYIEGIYPCLYNAAWEKTLLYEAIQNILMDLAQCIDMPIANTCNTPIENKNPSKRNMKKIDYNNTALKQITQAEREVLDLVVNNYNREEMAKRLTKNHSTINSQITSIHKKLHETGLIKSKKGGIKVLKKFFNDHPEYFIREKS